MLTHSGRLAKACWYFVIALTLAVVVAWIMVSMPGLEQSLGQIDIYMLTPATSVLIMLLVLTRDGYSKAGWQDLGMHRLGLRAWPLAVLAPLLLLTLTYMLTWLFGIGQLDWSLAPNAGQVAFVLIMQIIFATAEEIGWRGYLLPHLLPLGRTWALLLSGLCHGIWHLPVMLMTPYYHANGNRVVVVALFLVTLTAAGVLYGYVRLEGNSLWPAVLAHAVVNTTAGFWSVVTVAVVSADALEYWAGESGLFTLVETVLLALWLLYLTNRQERQASADAMLTANQ